MPGAVQAFADVNPVTLAVDAARALTVGHGDALSPVLGTLAWLVGPAARVRPAGGAGFPARVSRPRRAAG
jgi:hypothetical protein